MSVGTDWVRISFNPSKDDLVDKIKQKSAELIDLCNEQQVKAMPDGEKLRLWALAMTNYENACMWAVKAATAGKP